MNRTSRGILVAGACLVSVMLTNSAWSQDDPLADAECGNGVVEAGEECDDGDTNNADACLDTCEDADCGDGFVWEGVEACDDGNRTSGDGCDQACEEECPDGVHGLRIQLVRYNGSLLNAGGEQVSNPIVGRLCGLNLRAAGILSRLDIDNDDVADNSPDTDGDGLPDNWELGGVEAEVERTVFFPAPSAVVPGTPPTPAFTRRPVATSALLADSDEDGLTDFVEVFGLMFIDDNRNGVLDDPTEWRDFNGDGLPSPGEYPVDGAPNVFVREGAITYRLLHDFDGFVFTDPTNPDTDGDGILDGDDRDPLVNPRAFGIADRIIVRFQAEGNPDIDQDGLGNGMDMGNDLLPDEAPGLPSFQVIDNPENLRELLGLFREDLLDEGIVPESAIEDLLGADWDGNGLWRTTDVRNWSLVINPSERATRPPDDYFQLDPGDAETSLYYAQTFDDLEELFNAPGFDRYGERGIGLGWQEVLKPSSTDQFIPDKRVWAILYSWRMPGFDIDGDGFIGVPNLTATAEGPVEGTAMVALRRTSGRAGFLLADDVQLLSSDQDVQPLDDRIPLGEPEPSAPALNGVIEVGNLGQAFRALGCGALGTITLSMIALGLLLPMWLRRR